MLIKLMRDYLRAYRPWLLLVLVFQTIQAVATLSLPTLNANIIDNGALKGDTSYIWTVGAIMLAVTLVQVTFAVAATFFGARSAMGFGRDRDEAVTFAPQGPADAQQCIRIGA